MGNGQDQPSGVFLTGRAATVLGTVLLSVLFLGLASPGFAAVATLIATDWLRRTQPLWVTSMVHLLLRWPSASVGIAPMFGQLLAALLTAATRVQRPGKWDVRLRAFAAGILLVGALCAGVALVAFDPDDPSQADNIVGGKPTLLALQTVARTSLTSCLTYIGFMLGLRIGGRHE